MTALRGRGALFAALSCFSSAALSPLVFCFWKYIFSINLSALRGWRAGGQVKRRENCQEVSCRCWRCQAYFVSFSFFFSVLLATCQTQQKQQQQLRQHNMWQPSLCCRSHINKHCVARCRCRCVVVIRMDNCEVWLTAKATVREDWGARKGGRKQQLDNNNVWQMSTVLQCVFMAEAHIMRVCVCV